MKTVPGILGCRFFPFITLNISCHFLLTCKVSAEKSADRLMGVPLYKTCCFSFLLLIFSIFKYCHFNYYVSSLCWSYLELSVLPEPECLVSFPKLGKFLALTFSNMFLSPFYSLSVASPSLPSPVHPFLFVRSLASTLIDYIYFTFFDYSSPFVFVLCLSCFFFFSPWIL